MPEKPRIGWGDLFLPSLVYFGIAAFVGTVVALMQRWGFR
jgi:hypothetical protein